MKDKVKAGRRYGVEHGMEVFPRAVETAVDGAQGDGACSRKHEESEAGTLSARGPRVRFLLVLEGIDCKNEFSDGKGKHYAEKDAVYMLVAKLGVDGNGATYGTSQPGVSLERVF